MTAITSTLPSATSSSLASRFESPGAWAALRGALSLRNQAAVLDSAFGPSSSGTLALTSFPVMDQLALTSLTQAGLTGLFGELVDSPVGPEALATDLWTSAGWVAPGSASPTSAGLLLDLFA
jgi:hypothetical protein